MIIMYKLPCGGEAAILVQSIGAIVTNPSNKKEADLYTDQFPSGITVACTVKEATEGWRAGIESMFESVAENALH